MAFSFPTSSVARSTGLGHGDSPPGGCMVLRPHRRVPQSTAKWSVLAPSWWINIQLAYS